MMSSKFIESPVRDKTKGPSDVPAGASHRDAQGYAEGAAVYSRAYDDREEKLAYL